MGGGKYPVFSAVSSEEMMGDYITTVHALEQTEVLSENAALSAIGG